MKAVLACCACAALTILPTGAATAYPGQTTLEVGLGAAWDKYAPPGLLAGGRFSYELGPISDGVFLASGCWLAGPGGLGRPQAATGLELDFIFGGRRWRLHEHVGGGVYWAPRSEGGSSKGGAFMGSVGLTRAIDHRLALALDAGALVGGDSAVFTRLGVQWSFGF
jgi:hypothetical protein